MKGPGGKVGRCLCPCQGQVGKSHWSGSQLDLNFSLCVQRPSDLLLQQGVCTLQGLVLHGQLPEPQLRLLLGQALERHTDTALVPGLGLGAQEVSLRPWGGRQSRWPRPGPPWASTWRGQVAAAAS